MSGATSGSAAAGASWGKRLFVLALAGVGALAAAEVLLRIVLPEPVPLAPYTLRARHEGVWHDLDADGHALLLAPPADTAPPGAKGTFRPGLHFQFCYDARDGWGRPYLDADGCVDVHINAAGYRGPLRARERGDEILRLALVGDSFTFGHGVPYEASWGAVLEGSLPEGAEVLNFAISGYDVHDVGATLRTVALDWSPDRVLYGFFLNDLLVGEQGADPQADAWRGVDEAELHDQLFGEQEGLAARSRLLGQIERVLAMRRIDRLTQDIYAAAATPGSVHFEAWRSGLERMAADCAGAGIPLDVVVFPELIRLDATHPLRPAYAAVEEAARALGLGVVQVLPAWEGQEASELWVHPTDHHPNEIGHAAAAAAVLEHLRTIEPALGG